MKKGDRIRYTGKNDGARLERNGQIAEVTMTWPATRPNITCAMVRFPDGYEMPVYTDECEIVEAAKDCPPDGILVA